MKNLKISFARIASVALLALSILGINQMASYSDNAASYTYVGSSSWASNGDGVIRKFYIRAQGTSSQASGFWGTSGPGYTALGSAQSIVDSVAEDGSETATVKGNVRYYRLVADSAGNIHLGSYVNATATATLTVAADGTQSEGAEIVDANGNTLASIPLEPVVRGSVQIFH